MTQPGRAGDGAAARAGQSCRVSKPRPGVGWRGRCGRCRRCGGTRWRARSWRRRWWRRCWRRMPAAVGVTTGLVGAGGFGKTTLARMVAHDPRVRGEFGDGVVWVTVGEDAGALDLAAKLVSAARLFDPTRGGGDRPAGGRGGVGAGAGRVGGCCWWSTMCGRPRRWSRSWSAGTGAVRLFTTRQPGVLPEPGGPGAGGSDDRRAGPRAAHRRATGAAAGAGGGGAARRRGGGRCCCLNVPDFIDTDLGCQVGEFPES